MTDRFTITEQHLKLLKSMYVEFYKSAYEGAPMVDPKRPYGNSDIVGDIHEILYGVPFEEDDYGDRDEQTVERLLQIHRETGTALQIVLSTQSFVPGEYELADRYDSTSWRLKN